MKHDGTDKSENDLLFLIISGYSRIFILVEAQQFYVWLKDALKFSQFFQNFPLLDRKL